jgi:hypothetical protein
MFPRPLNAIGLNHRPKPTLDISHDGLIYFESIIGRFFEERCVGDGADVGVCAVFGGGYCFWGGGREGAPGDEVASELLGGGGGDGAGAAVCFEAIGAFDRGIIQE